MGKSSRSPRNSSPDNKRMKGDNVDRNEQLEKKETKALLKKQKQLEREQAAIAARLGRRCDDEMESISDDAASSRLQQPLVPMPTAPLPSGDLEEHPMMQQILTSLNALTVNVQTLSDGMSHLRQDMDSQRGQLDRVLEHVNKLETKTAQDFESYKESAEQANEAINKKIADMEKNLKHNQPTSARASGSAAAAGSGPASPAAAPRPADHKPLRLWLRGFGETLTTRFLVNFAKEAIAGMPPNMQESVRVGAPGFGAAVFLDCHDERVLHFTKDFLSGKSLKHRDSNGKEQAIRIGRDLSLPIRHRAKVLGELWTSVDQHMKTSLPGDEYKLGTSNGQLFLIRGDRPTQLFRTAVNGKGCLETEINNQGMQKIGASDDIAKAWVAAAERAAARLAPR